MRIVLDECLRRRLKDSLAFHDGRCLPEAGWAGVKNGGRLALAQNAGFQVFLTIDFSDDRSGNGILPEILRVLVSLEPGQLVKAGAETNS